MNLKHQFYRGYYDDFDPRQNASTNRQKYEKTNSEAFSKANDKLYRFTPMLGDDGSLNTTWFAPENKELSAFCNVAPMVLYTTYPGLIIGTGYAHETMTKEEISIGFYFDHTTGLPIIPGSSIKGVLRSFFPSLDKVEDWSFKDSEKAATLRKCFPHIGITGDWNDTEIMEFGRSIFYGQYDIFFPATILTADDDGRILGPDFITPHHDNPLREPTPLRMIKVLPNVGVKFRFRLKAFKRSQEEVTPDQKKKLFQVLLLSSGVGAKTNIGYGRFISMANPIMLADIFPDVPSDELKVKLNLGGSWAASEDTVAQMPQNDNIKSDNLADYIKDAGTYVVRVKMKKKRKGIVFVEPKDSKINDCYDSKILSGAIEAYPNEAYLQVTCLIEKGRIIADLNVIQRIK